MKHKGFTPGPWTAKQDGDDWKVAHVRTNTYHGDRITEDRVFSIRTGVIPNPADAALIAAAPALLAENERLREHNRRMEELLNDLIEDLQGGFDFSKEYQRAGLIGAIKVALLSGHEHESLKAALEGGRGEK